MGATKNGKRVGRPPSCTCGSCPKCRHAAYMRAWYRAKSPAERRELVEARNAEKVRAADRARHARDREQRIALMKDYAKTPHGRLVAARARAAWAERNPEKRAAQIAVGNALRAGRLARGECERAGDGCDGRVEAHHDDYSRPLDVRWLCSTHHHEHHRDARSTDRRAA